MNKAFQKQIRNRNISFLLMIPLTLIATIWISTTFDTQKSYRPSNTSFIAPKKIAQRKLILGRLNHELTGLMSGMGRYSSNTYLASQISDLESMIASNPIIYLMDSEQMCSNSSKEASQLLCLAIIHEYYSKKYYTYFSQKLLKSKYPRVRGLSEMMLAKKGASLKLLFSKKFIAQLPN
jgi:hypothetical protein